MGVAVVVGLYGFIDGKKPISDTLKSQLLRGRGDTRPTANGVAGLLSVEIQFKSRRVYFLGGSWEGMSWHSVKGPGGLMSPVVVR